MSFLEYLNIGITKASQSDQAVREVDQIFNDLNEDLKYFENGKLKISRIEDITIGGIFAKLAPLAEAPRPDYFKQDTLFIFLSSGDKQCHSKVAGWSQSMRGYPCILKFNNQELICNNSKQLVDGLKSLLSSIEFGNALNKLTKELKEIIKKENSSIIDRTLKDEKPANNVMISQDSSVGSDVIPTTKSKAVKSNTPTATARANTKAAQAKVPAKTAAAKALTKAAPVKAPAKTAAAKALTKAAPVKAPAKTAAAKALTKTVSASAPAKTAAAKAKTSSSKEK